MEKTLSVKIPAETLGTLKEIKKQYGVTIGYAIKIAVEVFYNKEIDKYKKLKN